MQADEIRHGAGVFWGVQYHPEISLGEVAGALRRQAGDLVEAGLARSEEDLEAYAAEVEGLHREPHRRDLAWRLGLDEEVTDASRRTAELRNFVDHLVAPVRSERRRARAGVLVCSGR